MNKQIEKDQVGEPPVASTPASSSTKASPQMVEESPPIVFMLAGQGSQYVNIARGLYENIPLFKELMDNTMDHIKTITAKDLKPILYPDKSDEQSPANVQEMETSQLIIFSVEYCLANLLIKGGLSPYAMIGYSFGEYIVACLAGVFSIVDALKLVVFRGALLKHTKGAMLSVPCPAGEVKPFLSQKVYLAIDNGESCVLSGSPEALEVTQEAMKKKRYFCFPVQVPFAIHSNLLSPIITEFEAKFNELTLNPPQIPFISNLTGTWITPEQAVDRRYWSKQMSRTVLFKDGLNTLIQDKKNSVFVEIGPGHDLGALLKRLVTRDVDKRIIDTIRPGPFKKPDMDYLCKRLQRMVDLGVSLDWNVFNMSEMAEPTDIGKVSANITPTALAESKVHQWNERYPIGTQIKSTAVDGEFLETETEAVVLFGHRAAVYVKNYNGYFDLDTITPV